MLQYNTTTETGISYWVGNTDYRNCIFILQHSNSRIFGLFCFKILSEQLVQFAEASVIGKSLLNWESET